MSLDKAIDQVRLAERDWSDALTDHWRAEPNDLFAARLRRFSDAADRQHRAFAYAAKERLQLKPLPPASTPQQPPYELRAGSGRIGPEDLWVRFDAQFADWSRALEGTDLERIARLFGELSETTRSIAAAVDELRDVAPDAPEQELPRRRAG